MNILKIKELLPFIIRTIFVSIITFGFGILLGSQDSWGSRHTVLLIVGLLFIVGEVIYDVSVFLFPKRYYKTKKRLINRSMLTSLFKDVLDSKIKRLPFYKIGAFNDIYKESYIIIGNGGAGKSTLLASDFIHSRALACRKIYFNSDEIENFNETQMSKYKMLNKMIVYLDGLDEIENVKKCKDALVKITSYFNEHCKKVIYKIACRTNFYYQHIESDRNTLFSNDIKVYSFENNSAYSKLNYTNEESEKYFKYNVDVLRQHISVAYRTRIDNIPKPQKEILKSPVLCIIYIYNYLLFNINIDYNDKFTYYNKFINEYYQRKLTQSTGKNVNDTAKFVFGYYIHGERIPAEQIEDYNIFKNFVYKGTNNVTFIHHTFFEYFIAKHIVNTLSNINSDLETILECFSKESDNDLSDIIRDGINNLPLATKQVICSNLFSCYKKTLPPTLQTVLGKDKTIAPIISSSPNKINGDYKTIIARESFSPLIIKKELILRFSRITELPDNYLRAQIRFLKFIYYNDQNEADDKIKGDLEYFSAILKRWCAIGASWLCNEGGGDEIEMDYVSKMIDHPGDDNTFDFANRSNTILYYGDILNQNVYEFRDSLGVDWSNAGKKRCERLMEQSNLKILCTGMPIVNEFSAIDEFNEAKIKYKKDIKNYRFRLFDMATVYTFLLSRLAVCDRIPDYYSKDLNYYHCFNEIQLDYEIPEAISQERKNNIEKRIELMKEVKERALILFEKEI